MRVTVESGRVHGRILRSSTELGMVSGRWRIKSGGTANRDRYPVGYEEAVLLPGREPGNYPPGRSESGRTGPHSELHGFARFSAPRSARRVFDVLRKDIRGGQGTATPLSEGDASGGACDAFLVQPRVGRVARIRPMPRGIYNKF